MSKISELSDGGALQSTDYLIAVRSGGNVKVQANGAVSGTTGQFSTSLNVDGTVTADGLTVDGGTTLNTSSTVFANLNYSNSNLGKLSTDGINVNLEANSNLFLKVNSATRAKFDGNGDISFYDSAGSSQSFYWDASTERLGLGTTSPAEQLHIANGNDAVVLIESTGSDATDDANIQLKTTNGTFTIQNDRSIGTSGALTFAGNTSNNIVIDHDSGNVGIGSSTIDGFYGSSSVSTRSAIVYSSSSTNVDTAPKGLVIRNDNTTTSNLSQLVFGTLNTGNTPIATASIYSVNDARTSGFSTGSLGFGTVGGSGVISERVRLDSSGNFIVGATSAFDSSSFCVDQSGLGQFRRDGTPLIVRRDSSAGGLIDFEEDGASVGSIGSNLGSNIYITSGNSGMRMNNGDFSPIQSNNTYYDNAINLGRSAARWKDLYLSGGVYLGGTGAANLLDDYEEGTWTPTCVCSGQTITTTQAIGRYTKIGRIVHAECAIIINTVSGTASGATTITGLPFANNGDSYSGMGALNYNDGFANTLYASWIQSTTAYMRSGTRSQSNDGGGFSAGGYINIRWSYITNA